MPTSHCPTRSSANFIANRQARMMTVFGRLKPGVTLEKAQVDLSTLAGQLAKRLSRRVSGELWLRRGRGPAPG